MAGFSGPYTGPFASQEAMNVADSMNGEEAGGWAAEHHAAECAHATGGWFAVWRNTQGERWTGAPWEACEACGAGEEETYHETL